VTLPPDEGTHRVCVCHCAARRLRRPADPGGASAGLGKADGFDWGSDSSGSGEFEVEVTLGTTTTATRSSASRPWRWSSCDHGRLQGDPRACTGGYSGTLPPGFQALRVFNHASPPQDGDTIAKDFPLDFGH
jgi:hypothetical protein